MTALRLVVIPTAFPLRGRHVLGGTALAFGVYGTRHDKETKRSLSLV